MKSSVGEDRRAGCVGNVGQIHICCGPGDIFEGVGHPGWRKMAREEETKK